VLKIDYILTKRYQIPNAGKNNLVALNVGKITSAMPNAGETNPIKTPSVILSVERRIANITE
jgi:hypothetical protein